MGTLILLKWAAYPSCNCCWCFISYLRFSNAFRRGSLLFMSSQNTTELIASEQLPTHHAVLETITVLNFLLLNTKNQITVEMNRLQDGWLMFVNPTQPISCCPTQFKTCTLQSGCWIVEWSSHWGGMGQIFPLESVIHFEWTLLYLVL